MTVQEAVRALIEDLHSGIKSESEASSYLSANIDHYSFAAIKTELTTYWNESVNKALTDVNKIINDAWSLGNNKPDTIHNAAKDFFSDYVSPKKNFKQEEYLANRTDGNLNVLQNDDKLDFTIKNYDELSAALKKSATRLLMPQYTRRVEVEDLNRNFWVIGQNLSYLNQLVLRLGDDLIGNIIGELAGLWENVHQIWLAILELAAKMDKMQNDIDDLENYVDEVNDSVKGLSARKTKVKITTDWSFNTLQVDRWFSHEDLGPRLYTNWTSSNVVKQITDYFTFKKGDTKYFGVLPMMEKQMFNSSLGVLYLPYNKTLREAKLNSMTNEQLEQSFVLSNSGGNAENNGELVAIERKMGDRPVRPILEELRTMNFVMISPYKVSTAPDIYNSFTQTTNPMGKILQQYRDILYYPAHTEELEDYVANTFSWLQNGYLTYLNFATENSSITAATTMFSDARNNVITIGGLIPEIRNTNFYKTLLASPTTIGNCYTNLLARAGSQNKLIADFYEFYGIIATELGQDLNDNDAPFFIDDHASNYTINTTNRNPFSQRTKTAITNYNKQNSLNGEDAFAVVETKYIFAGQQDYFRTSASTPAKYWYSASADGPHIQVRNADYSLPPEQPPQVRFDLLSNNIPFENFYEDYDSTVNAYTRTQDWNHLGGLTITGTDKSADFQLSVNKVDRMSGWWLKDKAKIFGNSYIFPRIKNKPYAVWYEFTQGEINETPRFLSPRISTYTTNELAASIMPVNSELCQITSTDWHNYNLYDLEITIPFANSNNDSTSYGDLIRLGKPYPSLKVIANEVAVTDIRNATAVNDPLNAISYDTALPGEGEDRCYFIDGFYGFENLTNYPDFTEWSEHPVAKNVKYDITFTDLVGTPKQAVIKRRRGNKSGGTLTDRLYYYGASYWNNKIYAVASSDMISAKSGTTKLPNGRTLMSTPVEYYDLIANFEYRNSGDQTKQQVVIQTTKDSSAKEWFRARPTPQPIVENMSAEIVKLGDNYPTSINSTSVFVKNTVGDSGTYPEGTYGIGSYHIDYVNCPDITNTSTSNPQSVSFVDYNALSNNTLSKTKRGSLSNALLKNIGTNYLKKLYNNITEPLLIATKIGVEYWKSGSNSGSQWQNGEVCDLFYVGPPKTGSTPVVDHLTRMDRLDGYWDRKPGSTTGICFSGSPAFRHFGVVATSITKKTVDDSYTINGSGYIVWWDRHKKGARTSADVMNSGTGIPTIVNQLGYYSKHKTNEQERVVAYAPFKIVDGSFVMTGKEYYRNVNVDTFTTISNSSGSTIFGSYSYPTGVWSVGSSDGVGYYDFPS